MRTLIVSSLAVLAVAASTSLTDVVTAQQSASDPWQPVRFLVGDWEGTASGEPGNGTARRTYSFVMKDRFLHERNVTTYPPQEKNRSGEVHEHWNLISYDRARKMLVMRQFHQEGFVNQYAFNAAASAASRLVFDGERFENVPESWRARETIEQRSSDEFIETFELGEAGKPLQVYSQTKFHRARK